MPYTAYPNDGDLSAFLTGLGLSVPPSLDLAAKVADAAQDWESATGWSPYLAARDADGQPLVSTRLFDPPGSEGARGSHRGGRSLYLRAGLLSLSSLAVGVVPDPAGSYLSGNGTQGSLLTPNLNFYLRPTEAQYRGEGFTEVEFIYPVRGVPQSIAIAGVWGRVLELPADVRETILQMAALSCVPELATNISKGVAELREGDEMRRFASSGVSPLSAEKDQWETKRKRLIARKKRVTA